MIPPRGAQQLYAERPPRVYAEQYRAGATLPVGALAAIEPMFPAAGGPYANTVNGVFPLTDTDWVVSNAVTGQAIGVLTDAALTERYMLDPGGGLDARDFFGTR